MKNIFPIFITRGDIYAAANSKYNLQWRMLCKKIVVRADNANPNRFICRKGDMPMDRLFYIVRGIFYIKENGREEITANEGSLVYLPADVEYESHWDKNTEASYIAFNYSLYNRFDNELHLSNRILIAAKDKSGTFYRMLLESAEIYLQHEKYVDLELQSQFYKLIFNIFRQQERKAMRNDKNTAEIYKAIIYLNDHYMTDITSEELAQMCNISVATFRRIFKKCKGISPMKYKQVLRMKLAKDMLESGVYTVSEVSELMKCTDLSHFNRQYMAEFGINPSVSKRSFD